MSAHADAPIASVLVASQRSAPWLRPVLWVAVWGSSLALVMANDHRLNAWWDAFTWRYSSLDYGSVVITKLVAAHVLILFLILMVTLDRRLRYRFLGEGAWVLASQSVVSTVLKQLFGRERPEVAGAHTIFLGPNLSNQSFSFPSGHATAAFALAAVLAVYYPRWRVVFIALACLVALARVQLDRHYFSDVLAGALLGWFWAMVLVHWLRGRSAHKAGFASSSTEPPSSNVVSF